jgi:hypothetical protein
LSVPKPEVGRVISDSYLWACEHQAERDGGVKDRLDDEIKDWRP